MEEICRIQWDCVSIDTSNTRHKHGFSRVRVTRSLVLCVCFVDRCLYFYFWPLCCLSFSDIRILIIPLVSSNSSLKSNSKENFFCQKNCSLGATITPPLYTCHSNESLLVRYQVFFYFKFNKMTRWKLHGQIIHFLHASRQFIFSIEFGDKKWTPLPPKKKREREKWNENRYIK